MFLVHITNPKSFVFNFWGSLQIGLAIFLFLHFDKKQPFSLQFSLQCALFCIFNLCISKKSCTFVPCLKKHAVWDSQNIRNVFNYPVQTALMIHGPVFSGHMVVGAFLLLCSQAHGLEC